jgi:hypothetical protein
MSAAGARPLREDNEGPSREEVLLQWERKIEAAESRTGRFDRPAPTETSTAPEPRRFERAAEPAPAVAAPEPLRHPAAGLVPAVAPQRRTITITGQPNPARRRYNVAERQLAQPDRVALWAFFLGLFLVAVAAGTAHA